MPSQEKKIHGLTPNTYAHLTSLLFFIGSLIYCYFILKISQLHYAFEIIIALVFPLLAYPFFKKADNWTDMRRLIILETGFNAICILAKITTSFEIDMGIAISWMFAVFFLFQTGGFISSQIKKKKYKCVPASIAMGIALGYWFYNSIGEKTIVTVNGEVQFWGANAPVYLQVMYVFWVANVFLVEFRQYVPKATMYLAHAATVIVALMSNEFFHARVLTASHLFVLSMAVVYKNIDWNGRHFSVIPILSVFNDDDHWMPTVFPLIMNIGCYIALLYGLFGQYF